jgi:hypothetical protein
LRDSREPAAPDVDWQALLLDAALAYVAGRRVGLLGDWSGPAEACLRKWASQLD